MTAKALSVRAPWWWFILHGGKDIENRDWYTRQRGTVYVHASKWWRTEDVAHEWNSSEALRGLAANPRHPVDEMYDLRGHIVGKVDIVDCVRESTSEWFFGEYGFVLANPVAFVKPVLCRGARGFFPVPDDVLAQLTEAA